MNHILHKITGTILFSCEGNLRDANLRYADLSAANLRCADLSAADLRQTSGCFSLGNPGNWPAHAWLRDDILSIRIGCREFRYGEAISYWYTKSYRLEQLAACYYAKAIADSRGWRVE